MTLPDLRLVLVFMISSSDVLDFVDRSCKAGHLTKSTLRTKDSPAAYYPC